MAERGGDSLVAEVGFASCLVCRIYVYRSMAYILFVHSVLLIVSKSKKRKIV